MAEITGDFVVALVVALVVTGDLVVQLVFYDSLAICVGVASAETRS